MSPVATRPRPAPARRRSDILGLLAAGVGLVAALGVLFLAMDAPPHVERVTINNPHEWSAAVEVSDERQQGWVGLGIVNKGVTHPFEEVLDQGRTWVFRFSYAGVDGGELRVSRADLQRSGWKIAVPDEFATRMREAGLEPSAR
jgi:hypothetical protein